MAVEVVWDGRVNGKGVRSRGVGPKNKIRSAV